MRLQLRFFFTAFLILFIFLSGCADKDAFSKFHFTEDEAVAFDNLVIKKVLKDNNLYAVVGAIDLTTLYPQRYKRYETFYIVIFAKDKKYLENFRLQLNKQNILELQKLPPNNEYAHLLQLQNRWSAHYLAKFNKPTSTAMLLSVALANGAKALLAFEKKQ